LQAIIVIITYGLAGLGTWADRIGMWLEWTGLGMDGIRVGMDGIRLDVYSS
jgi:hypothetical protein